MQSQVTFNGVAEKVLEKVWEALVKFNRVPEKVPMKVWEALGSGSTGFPRRFRRRSGRLWGQVQQGSGENSGEGLGGFGAEPGQVQQGSGEGSVKVWGALVQSQVRFNRVPDKVPERFGRFNKVREKVPEKM